LSASKLFGATSSRLELLQAPARQAAALEETDHRPWPVPDHAWVLAQTLDDQLFVHYRVPRDSLEALLPKGLQLDEHSGSAWLGVTPFAVTGSRLRGTLPLPLVSDYLQVNVRTYVTRDEKPGIWFFSLEASNRLAVEAGRRLHRVPFSHAAISCRRRGERFVFESAREDGKTFSARYEPVGKPARPELGSVEHFLTERYCMYAAHGGRLLRGEIHHRPWRLRPAEADIELNGIAPSGVAPTGEPLLHFSAREDMLLWPLEGVA
jgi:uncharacterized protein YqjF (DUF2071 family)